MSIYHLIISIQAVKWSSVKEVFSWILVKFPDTRRLQLIFIAMPSQSSPVCKTDKISQFLIENDIVVGALQLNHNVANLPLSHF